MLLIEIVKLMYEAGWRASHAYHNFGVSQDFFIIQKFVGHGQELTHIFTQPSNFDLSDLYCFDHSDRGSIFAAVTRTTIQPFAWCLAIFPNLYFKVSCQNRILWTSNFGLGKNIKMNLMETIMKTSKSPITTTNSYWVQKASAIVLKALCHWVAQTGLIWHWHLLSVTCMLVVTSRRPGRVSAEWVLFPRRRGEGQQIAPTLGKQGQKIALLLGFLPSPSPALSWRWRCTTPGFPDDPLIMALMGWFESFPGFWRSHHYPT